MSTEARVRRRRLLAGAMLLAAIAGIIAGLLSGGESRSGAHGRSSRATRRPGASTPLRVTVTPAASLPTALQDVAVAADPAGSGVIALGGLDGEEASSDSIVRIAAGRVSAVGTLPTPLHDACAAEVGGSVYLFGGGEQSSFSQILQVTPPAQPAGTGASGGLATSASSPSGGTRIAGSLPTPASDVGCAVVAGTVYVVGGYTGSEPLRTIVAWQPGGAPRTAGMLPKPLRYAAVAVTGSTVTIAGGTSGTSASRDIYEFDPRDGSVRSLGQLPYGVTHAAGASLDGELLVIGGRGASAGTQRREILAVSSAGRVTIAGELPRALSDLGAVAAGGRVTLVGGLDGAGAQQREVMALDASGGR